MNTLSPTERMEYLDEIDQIAGKVFKKAGRNIFETGQIYTSDNFLTDSICIDDFSNHKQCHTWIRHSSLEIHNNISIELDSKVVAKIPAELHKLAAKIEDSKYILELEDNWDQEGSSPIKKEVWIRTIRFLAKLATTALQQYKFILDTPVISPVNNGSIDLYWKKKDKYQMLINIPKNKKSLAEYYGDDYDKESSKGTFDSEIKYRGVLAFFINQNE